MKPLEIITTVSVVASQNQLIHHWQKYCRNICQIVSFSCDFVGLIYIIIEITVDNYAKTYWHINMLMLLGCYERICWVVLWGVLLEKLHTLQVEVSYKPSSSKLQWNLYKADTIVVWKKIHFMEMSDL